MAKDRPAPRRNPATPSRFKERVNAIPNLVKRTVDGADLMLRVGAGDEAAFTELVGRYQQSVLNTVYRYVGNRATAEDLTQDIFVRIFRAAPTYERRAKFETWLHRIVFNLCANHADYGRRRRTISIDQDPVGATERPLELPSDDASTPLDRIEGDEAAIRVRDAIARLPAQQRAAILMSRYQFMPYQEIAGALDVSLEAVKSLLFRARENLKDSLGPYVEGEVRDDV